MLLADFPSLALVTVFWPRKASFVAPSTARAIDIRSRWVPSFTATPWAESSLSPPFGDNCAINIHVESQSFAQKKQLLSRHVWWWWCVGRGRGEREGEGGGGLGGLGGWGLGEGGWELGLRQHLPKNPKPELHEQHLDTGNKTARYKDATKNAPKFPSVDHASKRSRKFSRSLRRLTHEEVPELHLYTHNTCRCPTTGKKPLKSQRLPHVALQEPQTLLVPPDGPIKAGTKHVPPPRECCRPHQ